jgi:histidine triad (HIT) family protein
LSAEPCIFCAIASGTAPASMVYADDIVLVFMDRGAINTGHLLVVPRRHVASLSDLDDETGARLFNVAVRMGRAIRRSGIKCEGINLLLADGEAAFQEVFHVHLHVIPRFKGDGFRIDAGWTVRPGREELDAAAALIRAADQAPHR